MDMYGFTLVYIYIYTSQIPVHSMHVGPGPPGPRGPGPLGPRAQAPRAQAPGAQGPGPWGPGPMGPRPPGPRPLGPRPLGPRAHGAKKPQNLPVPPVPPMPISLLRKFINKYGYVHFVMVPETRWVIIYVWAQGTPDCQGFTQLSRFHLTVRATPNCQGFI